MIERRAHRSLHIIDLNTLDYESAHRLQLETMEAIRSGAQEEDVLFLVEHPPVYTFGRKSKSDALLFGDADKFEIERGGEATYHNPGQLVAYPILKLEDEERDVHGYLRKLEQSIIDTLSEFGLESEAVPGATGVWLKSSKKKIASIGVAVRGWVTYHGIALNVENDLSGFKNINPCGFTADIMTSLNFALGPSCPSLKVVKNHYVGNFLRQFPRNLVNKPVHETGPDHSISHH